MPLKTRANAVSPPGTSQQGSRERTIKGVRLPDVFERLKFRSASSNFVIPYPLRPSSQFLSSHAINDFHRFRRWTSPLFRPLRDWYPMFTVIANSQRHSTYDIDPHPP